MSGDDGYSFLDCGGGRRLERFGEVTVSRPAPGAVLPAALPEERWRGAALAFERGAGWRGEAPAGWRVALKGAVMELRPAAAGQVGVFPEHDRVAARLESLIARIPAPRVLNLFAHTGLVTLRLARAGAAVAHVDAAPAAVRQARRNAELSGLGDAPVRWLVDDVLTFLRREARRKSRYHAVVADPPAHGRSGRREWRLRRDLPELLALAGELLEPAASAVCVSCHSEGVREEEVLGWMGKALPGRGSMRAEGLSLHSECGGRSLAAGFAAYAANGRDGA